MASYEEELAWAHLETNPTIISNVFPARIKEMRTKRLDFAGLSGGKIHSVNWRFHAPTGNLAVISLSHPNFQIPGYDQDRNQAATIEVPGLDSDEDRKLRISARMGGATLNILGVDLIGAVELLGDSPEAGLEAWLTSADTRQQGCMNVVAYSSY